MRTPAEERLWQRISIEQTGYRDPKTGHPSACFLWNGAESDGYGLLSIDGELIYVHVYHYILKVGVLPPGQFLDHLCRVRRCIRLEHLDPVSNKENTLRGVGPTAVNAAKTHCIRDHEFTPENTIIKHNPDGTTRRQCRECSRRRKPAVAEPS